MLPLSGIIAQKTISHFVFFNLDRERIQEMSFLQASNLTGAQLKYTWRELEPEKDQYEFAAIRQDLAYLRAHNKRMFIQVQDVTFDTARVNVPDYILEEEVYHGGVAIQYMTDEQDNIIRQDGYVSRRWDGEVAKRFHLLLQALGQAFDGQLEGINLPETSVGFGETGALYPAGFTPDSYRDAILAQMEAAKQAFSQSVVIQYANFMPGEWLPWENKGYLESLYQFAKDNDIGMGGPDIKIYKKAQMNHSYKFLKAYSSELISGMAVQWGNYEEINPKTGKQVTVEEIYQFGQTEVDLNYIFWSTQEPFYSNQLLPFLNRL